MLPDASRKAVSPQGMTHIFLAIRSKKRNFSSKISPKSIVMRIHIDKEVVMTSTVVIILGILALFALLAFFL
ncbi:hypothetical protein GCM10023143_30840 [Compostibacter hankyongensis]|uniref:Uncharacterized protein n=1 Tax=Compostibacter hankyongensis TaxID=1007089 RepID=A0ABP8G6D5_9BACT